MLALILCEALLSEIVLRKVFEITCVFVPPC